MFSPELLQNITTARIVLLGTVGILIILAFLTIRNTRDAINGVSTFIKRNALWIWSIAIGLSWAIGAATILLPAHTLLWGNQGDETFQIAFMEKIISGHPFADFFYANLSPFYPPLYFWFFGTLGRIFNWDGISAAQWGVIISYAVLPALALGFAKLCRWEKREQIIALFLSFAVLLFLPAEALVLKPYEAIAALLSVLWIVSFAETYRRPAGASLRNVIVLGITGGIIFLLYYFWFVLLIPAMMGLMIATRRIREFAIIGIITTIIASPFLIPYLHNLITLGQENYQATYFFPTDAHLAFPWASLSLAGLLAIGSIATYIKKPWTTVQRAVFALMASIFAWHIVQLVILATGGKPVMMSKPFLFLGGIAMMVPVVEWIVSWWETRDPSWRRDHTRRILIATIILLAPLLPNGLFLDDVKVQEQLEQNILPRTSSFVAENIRIFVPDYAKRTWLTSGLQDLNGILPLTHYLAWNPHFSHPAAHWKTRLEKLQTHTFEELGINALLFYKAIDENGKAYYPFFYEEDAWPNGTASKEIRFDTTLFSNENWIVAHEDNEWIILLRK